jgi:hypothetical protein
MHTMLRLKLMPLRVFINHKKDILMSKRMPEKESICLEKCYFFAENCRQKEDGTWDCRTGPEYCEEYCQGKS